MQLLTYVRWEWLTFILKHNSEFHTSLIILRHSRDSTLFLPSPPTMTTITHSLQNIIETIEEFIQQLLYKLLSRLTNVFAELMNFFILCCFPFHFLILYICAFSIFLDLASSWHIFYQFIQRSALRFIYSPLPVFKLL